MKTTATVAAVAVAFAAGVAFADWFNRKVGEYHALPGEPR